MGRSPGAGSLAEWQKRSGAPGRLLWRPGSLIRRLARSRIAWPCPGRAHGSCRGAFMLAATTLLWATASRLYGRRAAFFAAGLWAAPGSTLKLVGPLPPTTPCRCA